LLEQLIRAYFSEKQLNPACHLPSGVHAGEDEQSEDTERIGHFVVWGLERFADPDPDPGLGPGPDRRRRGFLLLSFQEPRNLAKYELAKRKE
jgi:hypothetical protein